MAFLPVAVAFPEPGQYCRYRDYSKKETRYLYLDERSFPLRFPRRIPSTAPGATSPTVLLMELDPDKTKKHRYMAYIGVRPGALYQLWHPADVQQFVWDNAQLTSGLERDPTVSFTYQESPYESPSLFIWIEPNRTPAIRGINTMQFTTALEIIIIAAKYVVREQDDLDPTIIARLREGSIPSIPISFGGEI